MEGDDGALNHHRRKLPDTTCARLSIDTRDGCGIDEMGETRDEA